MFFRNENNDTNCAETRVVNVFAYTVVKNCRFHDKPLLFTQLLTTQEIEYPTYNRN